MKLRYKLNLLIIGLIILSISIPSSVYFYFSKKMIKTEVDEYLKSELSKNVQEFYGWLDAQSQTVFVISNIIQHNLTKDEITTDFLQSYQENSNISDIYIGFSDGSFMSGLGWIPDPGYDPRVRPWYLEAQEAGKLNISNVYYDLTSKQYATSIGIPLIDQSGKNIGVLGADILLHTFYTKIQDIQLDNYGYAYLMDNQGNILVHKDKSLIGKNYNQLIDNGIQTETLTNSTGEIKYTYQGKHKIAVYQAVTGTNWLLVLVVEEAQIYEPLTNLMWIYFSIVFVTIIFAIIMTSIFNHSIIKRLHLLSNASIALSKGQFDIEISDLGTDEIGDVSDAFNRMKHEIYEKISEIDASRVKYKELIENTVDAICSVSADGYLTTANTTFLELFQIGRSKVGSSLFDDLLKNSELGAILIVLSKEVFDYRQLISRNIDNIENHYYNVTMSPIMDKADVKGITCILHDVSDLELSRSHLEWVSHHDMLTQLPNRLKFMEDMDSIILKAKSGSYPFAILFIDLDDFKNINDTLGYSAGDVVLQMVASILSENYITYRIGADEFAVLINSYTDNTDLEKKVTYVADLMHQSFKIDLNTVYNSVTIGVALYPKDFVTISEMMIRADAALNYAKLNKKSEVQYYETSITQQLEQRVILEKGLRMALDQKEFMLYYQPIIISGTNKIKGFEALIRWKHEGKIISPAAFMPIAENMSLIHDIGLWVIQQSLYDLKNFQDKTGLHYTMAINLSTNQLKQIDFCNNVIKIIKDTQVDPNDIEFEITETVLIESLDLIKQQFQPLIDLGVKISLDDFGTGYSSLNYLQHFPFHILKIDKSFIDFIRKDTVSRSLVNHIIDIAHGMDMEIVAEGVENELQKSYLLDKFCDYLQGYLFSKPIPAEEVLQYIQREVVTP